MHFSWQPSKLCRKISQIWDNGTSRAVALLVFINPLVFGYLPYGRVAIPNRMNFRKSSEGRGVIFNPKSYTAGFGTRLFDHEIDSKE